jgi:hypothetical protein
MKLLTKAKQKIKSAILEKIGGVYIKNLVGFIRSDNQKISFSGSEDLFKWQIAEKFRAF